MTTVPNGAQTKCFFLQVAVWSQFMSYDPTLPQLTPSLAATAAAAADSCRNSNNQQLLLHSSSGQLSDTRLSFMAPSLCVDGTSTQLLVQSFNHRPELDGHRSLLHFQSVNESGLGLLSPRCDDEETIIEMESKSDLNASPKPTLASPSSSSSVARPLPR